MRVLISREEVGNAQYSYLWINRGIVAVRGIRHLYRTVLHLIQSPIRVAQSAAVDNFDSQRTIRPNLDVTPEALIHAIDEVNAKFALGQGQANLNIFLAV